MSIIFFPKIIMELIHSCITPVPKYIEINWLQNWNYAAMNQFLHIFKANYFQICILLILNTLYNAHASAPEYQTFHVYSNTYRFPYPLLFFYARQKWWNTEKLQLYKTMNNISVFSSSLQMACEFFSALGFTRNKTLSLRIPSLAKYCGVLQLHLLFSIFPSRE